MRFPHRWPQRMRITPLVALVLLPTLMVGAARASDAPLHDGLDLAIKTFGELREKTSNLFDTPAERTEAARALQKLSARLDSLANAKQAFTDRVTNATWPRDRNKVGAAAGTLKEEVRKTRFALTDFFVPMSADWQTRGGDIQTRLELNLRERWQNPDDIARDLRLDGASSEQLRAESEQLISQIHQLKDIADALANDLSKTTAQ